MCCHSFWEAHAHLQRFQTDLCQGQEDKDCLPTQWFPRTAVSFSSPEAPQAGRIPVSSPQAQGAQRPAGGSETLADSAWEVVHCYWSEMQNSLGTAGPFPFLTTNLVSFLLIPLALLALWKLPVPDGLLESAAQEWKVQEVLWAMQCQLLCAALLSLSLSTTEKHVRLSQSSGLGSPFWTDTCWGHCCQLEVEVARSSCRGCGSWLISFSANKPALECI